MDQIPGNLPISQAEAIREAAKKQAIYSSGYKFIMLTLKNVRCRRMSGVEIIQVTPYIDEMQGNVQRFRFDMRGGFIDFEFDMSRGQYRYAMLDSDHNRKFLASHYHLDSWDIEDEKVKKEIAKMSKAIETALKGKGSKEPDAPESAPEIKVASPEEVASIPEPTMDPIGSDLVTPRGVGVLTP